MKTRVTDESAASSGNTQIFDGCGRYLQGKNFGDWIYNSIIKNLKT
jgi:hypothetical protein